MPCVNSIKTNGKLNNKNMVDIDPNIHNGMMTKVWGPAGWLFLHCVSFGYPHNIDINKKEDLEKVKNYKKFFKLIGKILPCKYCRDSYLEFIKENPIDPHLTSRKELTKWFYDIHNKVNRKLGVPECEIPSFQDVESQYEQYRAKCKKTTENERQINASKGCIRPANGTPKRCIVKVVNCNAGDITRRDNSDDVSNYNFPKQEEYYIIHRSRLFYVSILAIIILIFVSYILIKNKKRIKL